MQNSNSPLGSPSWPGHIIAVRLVFFIVSSLWPLVISSYVALPVFKGSRFFCWIFVPVIFGQVAEFFQPRVRRVHSFAGWQGTGGRLPDGISVLV